MLHTLAHDTPSGKHDNCLRLDPKLYGPPYASGRVFELASWQRRFAVAAAGIASYDLAFDPDGRVLAVALACARMLTAPANSAV
jgi:hypothetical protein